MMTRGKRLLIAVVILALSVGYGWHSGIANAEQAIRQHPGRFADSSQLRVQLGVRGATGGFIVGAPLAIVAYVSLAVFGPRKRSTPKQASLPIAGKSGSG